MNCVKQFQQDSGNEKDVVEWTDNDFDILSISVSNSLEYIYNQQYVVICLVI